MRDVGKALAFAPEQLVRLSKALSPFAAEDPGGHLRAAGMDPSEERVRQLVRLCGEIQDLPRHLGQHPGGLVLAAGRLDEVVPLQPAAMEGRVIVQWDKDSCADRKLIKIDLLGLGMLAALEEARTLCPKHDGAAFDLADLPPDDPAVYDVIQRAETVGMFQIESRAQMSVLPRMKPRTFYDLVIQVALIRPGPIVGDLMHPYLRRRTGREGIRYPHPLLEPILKRTLGVPLFQEQVMRLAMLCAGFTGAQAEQLRRAMGFKRPDKAMDVLREELYAGMKARGIVGQSADEIAAGITAFSNYGFPESHAISFALLAYASAWLKVRHPAIFYTCLLNAQPMGFYSPSSLVQDAKRHGIEVREIDVTRSGWDCVPEDPARPARVLRLGLRYVRGLRRLAGEKLLAARAEAPFTSLGDLRARCPELRDDELQRLAGVGALGSLEHTAERRDALWQVSALGRALLARVRDGGRSPLRPMDVAERLEADLRGTGLTLGPHPLELLRLELTQAGILRVVDLRQREHGRDAEIAGVVIVRQRPSTAKGMFFMTLEDESGIANITISAQDFEAHQMLLVTSGALRIGGPVQQQEGVTSLRGRRFLPLQGVLQTGASHDFR